MWKRKTFFENAILFLGNLKINFIPTALFVYGKLFSHVLARSDLFINFLLMIRKVVEGQDWLDRGSAYFNVHTRPLKALKNRFRFHRSGVGPEILHFCKSPQGMPMVLVHRPHLARH